MTTYQMCPECEASFATKDMVNGHFPVHCFNGVLCKQQQTLQEWSVGQPYIIREHASGAYWIPDSTRLINRVGLWNLSDYRVTSVTGGSIWLMRKDYQR